jgi:hypothetical protein
MSSFKIFVEDDRQQFVPSAGTTLHHEPNFLIGTTILRARKCIARNGARVVHMNGSGGIENVFDTTSSVYGDSP